MREARSIAQSRRHRDQSVSGLLLHVCQDAPCVVRCYRPRVFPIFTTRQILSGRHIFSVRDVRNEMAAANTPPFATLR